VEDAGVSAEVLGEGKVHLDAALIPSPHRDPTASVERNTMLPMLPEPVPTALLILIGERHAGILRSGELMWPIRQSATGIP
jgi:hypothetical protein